MLRRTWTVGELPLSGHTNAQCKEGHPRSHDNRLRAHQLPGLTGLALELGGVASSSPSFILPPNCAESRDSRPNATILKTAEPMLPP